MSGEHEARTDDIVEVDPLMQARMSVADAREEWAEKNEQWIVALERAEAAEARLREQFRCSLCGRTSNSVTLNIQSGWTWDDCGHGTDDLLVKAARPDVGMGGIIDGIARGDADQAKDVADLQAEVAGLHLALTTVERLLREERAKVERLNGALDRARMERAQAEDAETALAEKVARVEAMGDPLPLHRTEAGYPNCSTCDGGGCLDCTDAS